MRSPTRSSWGRAGARRGVALPSPLPLWARGFPDFVLGLQEDILRVLQRDGSTRLALSWVPVVCSSNSSRRDEPRSKRQRRVSPVDVGSFAVVFCPRGF